MHSFSPANDVLSTMDDGAQFEAPERGLSALDRWYPRSARAAASVPFSVNRQH